MTALINADTSSGVIVTSDTSGNLALQSAGTTKLTVSSAGVAITGASMTSFGGGVITSETAVASTSGTSIDFISIPSWVKRVTVMFDSVSTNGTSIIQIQLGDSGGIETTNYLGTAWTANTTNTQMSTGLLISGDNAAASVYHGSISISLLGSNIWTATGSLGRSNATTINSMGGSKTLSTTLDRVRITTVNGTDTFDAGSINILYEG